ncbi:TPA: hypothetical protein DCX16_06555, partial [bacterium]|nr:hypothetical protein [bacterium]
VSLFRFLRFFTIQTRILLPSYFTYRHFLAKTFIGKIITIVDLYFYFSFLGYNKAGQLYFS